MEPVILKEYTGEQDIACGLIQKFWKAHNNCDQSAADALADLTQWTREGHKLYILYKSTEAVGFIHLGSRGCEIDWLEDLFVVPKYQNQGIGTYAIRAVEAEVQKYSGCLYIEAAARNQRAIALYRKLGYNCLNTITIRKDFDENAFDVLRTEKVYDLDFQIRKEK